jgi:hypothetical protein
MFHRASGPVQYIQYSNVAAVVAKQKAAIATNLYGNQSRSKEACRCWYNFHVVLSFEPPISPEYGEKAEKPERATPSDLTTVSTFDENEHNRRFCS